MIRYLSYGLLAFIAGTGTIYGQSTWTQQLSGTSESLLGVGYGNGGFGVASDSTIFRSPDGATWVQSTSSSSYLYRGMGYTGTHWFAPSVYSNGKIHLSASLPILPLVQIDDNPNAYYSAVASGNGTLVSVGWSGKIDTSTNGGRTWTTSASPTGEDLVDVLFDGTSFIALGLQGIILQSSDGLFWNIKGNVGSSFFSQLTADLEFGQGSYVACSFSGTYRSTDLVNWTRWTGNGIRSLNAVEYANGKFVGVGDAGKVVTSSDGGISWDSIDSGVSANLEGIAFGNGFWVAVGQNGVVIRAPEDETPTEDIALTIHPAAEIRWLSSASYTYQVKWSFDMIQWFDFGLPITGDGAMHSVFDTTRDNRKKVYRVVGTQNL